MSAYLHNIHYKDTIPFIPPITIGKVIKVYDGDTFTLASRLPYNGSPIYRFSVRINGIDCPEMKTTNKSEKQCAELARQKVYDMIFNNIVELKNVKLEKYGRVLADVYYNDISIGEMLCKCNLAVTYDGGTKQVPEDWMEFHSKYNLDTINNVTGIRPSVGFLRRIYRKVYRTVTGNSNSSNKYKM